MKNAFLKIIFLLTLLVVFEGCISKPNSKVVAKTRVINSLDMEKALIALNKRLTKFNVPAVITQVNETDIRIALSTDGNIATLEQNLLLGAKLEFYETISADYMLAAMLSRYKKIDRDTMNTLQKIIPEVMKPSPILGYVKTQDANEVMHTLKNITFFESYEIKNGRHKLALGIEQEGNLPIYFLKETNKGRPAMEGDMIAFADQNYDQAGRPTVSIEMNKIAAKKWEKLTRRAAKEQFNLAIVIDDFVYSAPGVMTAISGGRSSITGDFSVKEAQKIATTLNLGYLPKMELVSFEVIKD